jgi:cell shape-determining protein MreD
MKFHYSQHIIHALLAAFVASVQMSLVASMPGWLSMLGLALSSLVFVLVLNGRGIALVWALSAGLVMDTFSFQPFGTYLLGLYLVVLLADFLLNHVFTDRSLYSFWALICLVTTASAVLTPFLSYVLAFGQSYNQLSQILTSEFWLSLGIGCLANAIFTTIAFYFFNYIGHRLKPAFLIRHGK